jgi:uncharacterized protein YdaU (DUF1376 family)
MTLEEVGLYIRLLLHQWITGSVPSDPRRAASLAHIAVETFEKLWPVVGQKFQAGPDGRLRNARLELVREEQRQWREKQAASGRKGAAARWADHGKPNGKPNGDPIGDPNGQKMALQSSVFTLQSSSSVSDLQPSKGKARRRPFLVPPEAAELVDRLRQRMLENMPDFQINERQITIWGREATLMIERDRRDPGEVLQVIDWCQGDPFWKTNILSLGKLREKFPQLKLKMQSSNGGAHGRQSTNDPQVAKRAAENFLRRHGNEGFNRAGGESGSGAKPGPD